MLFLPIALMPESPADVAYVIVKPAQSSSTSSAVMVKQPPELVTLFSKVVDDEISPHEGGASAT